MSPCPFHYGLWMTMNLFQISFGPHGEYLKDYQVDLRRTAQTSCDLFLFSKNHYSCQQIVLALNPFLQQILWKVGQLGLFQFYFFRNIFEIFAMNTTNILSLIRKFFLLKNFHESISYDLLWDFFFMNDRRSQNVGNFFTIFGLKKIYDICCLCCRYDLKKIVRVKKKKNALKKLFKLTTLYN